MLLTGGREREREREEGGEEEEGEREGGRQGGKKMRKERGGIKVQYAINMLIMT